MNKYEVGYIGEIIGVYYADTEAEAIAECNADMRANRFVPDTPASDRMRGMIANKVGQLVLRAAIGRLLNLLEAITQVILVSD